MDPSIAVLTHAGMAYRPLAPGLPHQRRLPTQGLPFTDGPFGGLAGMAMAGPLARLTGAAGMVPMGVEHDQNVYDRIRNQQFSLMQMQAMQAAAQADRDAYVRTFRGLAAVTGTPFGGEQRRAATALADSAVAMSPFLVEAMPDLLDQLGGVRGSNAVMARRLVDAGRYRIDPVTGRMGMSAASVGAMAGNIFGDLYSPQNLPRMQGITAGQLGSLAQELQARGMIGTAAAEGRYAGVRADDPRAATLRAIDEIRRADPAGLARAARDVGVDLSRPGGVTGADLDRLGGTAQISDRLRAFDATRVKTSLKKYADVVAAMRDIFGDMGRPNAPMAELLAGIDALTLGGAAQIDPGRLSLMVRNTYNLAKQTGVTMDNVLAVQQHAAARAGQLGLEPTFGVQAAYGGLAFGGAYRAQGHAAFTAWGAMNADQVQQLDTNLRVQAAGSNTANRLAVAARLAEQGGGFAADSEAARFAAAVRAGQTSYRGADGSLRTVSMGDREFTRMVTAGGTATEADVQAMLGQRATNREYVERLGISDTVRRLQGTDELHPFVGHRLQETLSSAFRDNLVRGGVTAGDASRQGREAAAAVSQRVTRRMFDMSTEEFADTTTRNRAVAGFIGEELDAAGQGGVLAGLAPGERAAFLARAADRFYGAANRAIAGGQYRAFGNLQNVHRLTNQTTLDESDRQRMSARFTSEMQEALAPLGRGSMLQRAADALQSARPDDPAAALTVVAQALGGVRTDDINRALMPRLQELVDRRRAVEDMQAEALRAPDSETRAAALARLETARRELAGQAAGLARTGEQFGLFTADSLSHQDLARAAASGRGLAEAQADLVGVRGNFGAEVTARQVRDMRDSLGIDPADPRLRDNPLIGPLTHADRMAVAVAARQRDVEAVRRHLTTGAPLDERLAGELRSHADQLRASPAAARLHGHALNLAAADVMAANVDNLSPEALAAVTPDMVRTDELAAAAVVRGRRRQIATRAPAAAVDALARAHPHLAREEAADVANARVRAARLGVDQQEVEDFRNRPENRGRFAGPLGEMDAINAILTGRAAGVFEATGDEAQALTRLPGYVAPTAADLQRYRQANPTATAGMGDLEVNHLVHVQMAGWRKQQAARQRFDAFWASTEGAAFREQADQAGQDTENVAARLLSPQMFQRLGTRAGELAEDLRGGQQRLRELALYHAGGDVSRLLARDLTGLRGTPAEAAQTAARVHAEIDQIQARRQATLTELSGQEGLPGRRFQLGDEMTVRARVLSEHVAAGNMTRAQADAYLAQGLSPERANQIDAMRRQVGSEAAARTLLGLAPGVPLSPAEQARVTAARFGAGTDAAARGVLGPLTGQQPAETDAAFAARREAYDRAVADVRRGLFSPAVARERLGIPADTTPADVLQQIERGREQEGNAAEAARLMGRRPGDRMSGFAAMRHAQLTYDVGVTRRLGAGGETALLTYADRTETLRRLAASRGLDPDAVEHMGEAVVLSAGERERLTAARRGYDVTGRTGDQLRSRAAALRDQIHTLRADASEGGGRRRAAAEAELRRVEGQIAGHGPRRRWPRTRPAAGCPRATTSGAAGGCRTTPSSSSAGRPRSGTRPGGRSTRWPAGWASGRRTWPGSRTWSAASRTGSGGRPPGRRGARSSSAGPCSGSSGSRSGRPRRTTSRRSAGCWPGPAAAGWRSGPSPASGSWGRSWTAGPGGRRATRPRPGSGWARSTRWPPTTSGRSGPAAGTT